MAYSPSLFDVLLGVEQAIKEGDTNIRQYLSLKQEEALKLMKQIEKAKKEKRREEKDLRSNEQYEYNTLKKRDKEIDKQLGFWKHVPGAENALKKEQSEIQKRMAEISSETIERLSEDHNKNQNYATDEQKSFLEPQETLSERIASQTDEPETSAEKIAEAISQERPELTDQEYEQGQKLLKWITEGKDIDFFKSIPSGWLETGEGLSGILGAKNIKQKIREAKQVYEEKVGVDDRDAIYAQAGRLTGDISNPLGLLGRGIKAVGGIGKYVSKVPGFLRRMGSGSLYGAIQAEKDDENPIRGAAIGAGATAALESIGKGLAKAKKGKFEKIKEGSTFTKPEEILQRTEVMGKEATIPELVGDETMINKIKKDSSVFNKNRMNKIERNIKETAKNQMAELPKGEEKLMEPYGNLKNVRKKAGEATASLYDVVKESGIGSQGLLEKPLLKEWIQAIKHSQGEIKGLPKMKPNGAHVKDVEKLLMIAPDNPKDYRSFYIKNADQLPTAGDFLKYRSRVKNMLEKSGSAEVEGLTNLSESIDRIIEEVDTTSSLAKANKAYKTKIAPLNQKDVKTAMTAASFAESKEGRPKISKVFGEQSNENNLVFKQLPTEDKKRVIGAFLEENLKKEKNPARAMIHTWEKLPDYIKLTDDSEIKKIIEGMRSLAQTDKTLSSMQRSTTADIGSRQAVDKAMKIGRWLGYGSSIFVNPTFTAGLGLTEGLAKGGFAVRHALLRKGVSQKQLKYYLKPELLDELYSRKTMRFQKPIIKIQEEYKKKGKNYVDDNK